MVALVGMVPLSTFNINELLKLFLQTYILQNSNSHQRPIQDILGNYCQYHREDLLGIHCQCHNLLHQHHKDYQGYKSYHLQQKHHNSNQSQDYIQVKLDNCLTHRHVHLSTQHQNHNLLDFPHRGPQLCKNLLLHCSNNRKKIQSQENICNCQFRTCDLPCTDHHGDSHPRLLHRDYSQYNIQLGLNVIKNYYSI